MITMKQALSVIVSDIFRVYKQSENPILYAKIYDEKTIRDKFDLKHTNVVKIKAYFVCGDFEGYDLVLEG